MSAWKSRCPTTSVRSRTVTSCGLRAKFLWILNFLEFLLLVLSSFLLGNVSVDDSGNIWILQDFVGHSSTWFQAHAVFGGMDTRVGFLLKVGCFQDCGAPCYLAWICQHVPVQLQVMTDLKRGIHSSRINLPHNVCPDIYIKGKRVHLFLFVFVSWSPHTCLLAGSIWASCL